MTADEIIAIVEDETGLRGITLDSTMDSLGVQSLEFLELLLRCNVPNEKATNINTVGDIVRAVCAETHA